MNKIILAAALAAAFIPAHAEDVPYTNYSFIVDGSRSGFAPPGYVHQPGTPHDEELSWGFYIQQDVSLFAPTADGTYSWWQMAIGPHGREEVASPLDGSPTLVVTIRNGDIASISGGPSGLGGVYDGQANGFYNVSAQYDGGMHIHETWLDGSLKADGTIGYETWAGRFRQFDPTYTYPSVAWTSPVDMTPTAAVPEPETYALMLAGVALLGWRARKAQRG